MYQGLKHINYQFITELISKMYSDWGIIPYLLILILVIYLESSEFRELWKDKGPVSILYIILPVCLHSFLYLCITLFIYYMVFS